MKRMLTAFGRGGALLALTLAAVVGTGTAHAAGTQAGTVISNTATLDYSVGGVTQNQIGSSKTGNTSGAGTATTFLVDNKVNVLVATTDTTPVLAAPGASAVTTTFTVSNTGNNTQDFALTAKTNVTSGDTVLSATDNFDLAGTCTFRVGSSAAGPWATQSYIGNLGPDGVAYVQMLCPIPNTRVDGDIAGVALTATAKTAGTTGTGNLSESASNDPDQVDIVFADVAGTDDSARQADHSDRSAYRVNSSRLTITKVAATLCDPIKGSTNPLNIPNAYVRYTVTIANAVAAGASASLSTITDQLDANVRIDPDLIVGTGAGAVCNAVGSGGVATSAATRSVSVTPTGTSRPGTYPKYLTSATGDADGVGVTAGGLMTINFGTVLPAEGTYLAGELKPGESVTVVYNVKIQ